MSITPEEYFQGQTFAKPGQSGSSFTEAELAFMRKYMGLDTLDTLKKIGIDAVQEDQPQQVSVTVTEPVTEPVAVAEPEAVLPVQEAMAESVAEPHAEAPSLSTRTVESVAIAPDEEPGFAEPEAKKEQSSVTALVEGDASLVAAPIMAEEIATEEHYVPSSEHEPEVEHIEEVSAEVAEAVDEPADVSSGDNAEPTTMPSVEDAVQVDELSVEEVEPVSVTSVEGFDDAVEQVEEVIAPVAETAPQAISTEAVASDSTAQVETPEQVVEPVAGVVAPPAGGVAPAASPAVPYAGISEESLDDSDIATFKETTSLQFDILKASIEALKADSSDSTLADAMFRSLVIVQNSSKYMELEDIRLYAERTAGIVDQGRKSGTDFSFLVDLLSQECSIIEDMVKAAISTMEEAPASSQEAKADGAEEASEAVQVEESAPVAEPEAITDAVPPVQEELATEPNGVATATPAPAKEPEEDLGSLRTMTPQEPSAHEEMELEVPLAELMRKETELQMVGFFIGNQEFTVPTFAVQEVIRYETPVNLPKGQEFDYVAGVINLRGKVTPLVYLRDMLEITQPRQTEDRFIIVCRRKGMQVGLIIERVHTMYRVPQVDIEWGVETHLGINVDFISGLLKLDEKLVAIVSVDSIVDHVLN